MRHPARHGKMLPGAMRRRRSHEPEGEDFNGSVERIVTIDAAELSGLFSAPQWLRDLGLMTWLLVGIGAGLGGMVWLLGLTASITVPVILGCISAAVAGPLVAKLGHHGVPRGAGAAIVLLGLVAIGVLILMMVLGGLSSQSEQINAALNAAVSKVESAVKDAGVASSDAAKLASDIKKAVPQIGNTLLQGVADGISGLTSLVFTLSFAIFSTFFLLKDGP